MLNCTWNSFDRVQGLQCHFARNVVTCRPVSCMFQLIRLWFFSQMNDSTGARVAFLTTDFLSVRIAPRQRVEDRSVDAPPSAEQVPIGDEAG